VVSGPAGSGKTRLLAESAASARHLEADVLAGRALELARELPYSAVTGALRTRLEAENAPEDLLDDFWLSELSRSLPELRLRYPDLPPPAPEPTLEPTLLCEAVVRLGQARGAKISSRANDRDSELRIAEHTTDTAGFTDLLFGATYDVVGLGLNLGEVDQQLVEDPAEEVDVAPAVDGEHLERGKGLDGRVHVAEVHS
jgi:hypothetical protein